MELNTTDGNTAKDATLQIILQQLNTLTQSTTEIRNLLLAQNEKIESCLTQVTVLKEETDILKSKVHNLEMKIQETNLEETYNEVKMRFEREKNLIIFGLEETVPANEVETLINNLILPHTVAINHITRLGKHRTGVNRLVKVELSSAKDVVTVLRNTSKVSKSSYPLIRIKSDKTPKQMKQLGALYDDLKARRANGDTNLAIRYVNNIPKIVTVSDYHQGNSKRTREEEESPRQNQLKRRRTEAQSSTATAEQIGQATSYDNKLVSMIKNITPLRKYSKEMLSAEQLTALEDAIVQEM
ncbi:unnamed protein product [Phaedon cochleariae]|uniref:Uncharacterized protein n=1 Tax=Phaedon cochleariae TaxID=80249 RepID=A0A9P0DNC4_PHACE|nr:unnamed protein product [Phaedon cochleariae]